MSWSLVLWVFCCFCDKWVPSCNFVFRLTSSSFPGCEVLGKGGRGGGGNWGGSVGTREGSRSPVLGVAGLLLARAFLGFVLERGSSFWSFVPGGVAGEGSRPHLWRRLGGAGGGWGCSVSLVTCDHGREKRRGHLTAGQGCRACCHACRMGGTFAWVKPWEKSKFRHLSSFQQLSQDTVDKMVWPLKNQVFDLRGSSFTEERSSLTLCMCGKKKQMDTQDHCSVWDPHHSLQPVWVITEGSGRERWQMTEGGVVIEENAASDVFVVWEEKKDCPGEDADIISTV